MVAGRKKAYLKKQTLLLVSRAVGHIISEITGMPKLPTSKRSWLVIALLGLIATVLIGQQFHVLPRVWYQIIEWQSANEWRDQSIWLPDYVASLQAVPVEGVPDNLSGLTYDSERDSLWAVINQPASIIELSLQGQVVRQIPLKGFRDPEAITYLSPDRFVITDERENRLLKIHLKNGIQQIDAADSQQLSLGISLRGNKGFEGVAYDSVGKRLFVAKERDPLRIFEIQGFPHAMASSVPMAVHVDAHTQHNNQLFLRDLSGLYYDQATGHLLAVSDESRLVVEFTTEGKPISRMSLRRGQHGLKADIPQVEGVAMDASGNLYLVSEPNLFYIFNKRRKD